LYTFHRSGEKWSKVVFEIIWMRRVKMPLSGRLKNLWSKDHDLAGASIFFPD